VTAVLAASGAAPGAPPGAPLSLDRITKLYGNVAAVREVSLDVAGGEFLTLLGPSGSGKTTTLMIVAGFVDADGGEVLVGGRPVSAVPPHKRGLGVVFQHYALFPHMTVGQNVAFPLELRGVRGAEARPKVSDVLDLVRLSGLDGRYPRQLSGGQQQRVALARALVFGPPVLLMDEPLGALDRQLRAEMQLEIKAIQRRLGITVVYVTHDQGEALTMSDRIAVMRNGRIEQAGSPADLYERPTTPFVAAFLGECNFFDGRVVDADGRRTIVEIARGFRLDAGTSAVSPGAQVVAAIRPEKLWFVDHEATKAGSISAVDGTIEEVVYVGDLTRYQVRVAALDALLHVERQNRGGVSALARGDHIRLAWDPADVRVLRPEPPK
jgi:spermidine/putrescine ABC transporter ATP-binding subunit